MKTIFVSLTHLDRVDDVINMSAYIASKYDSHVIGFYPIPGKKFLTLTHPVSYLPLDAHIQKPYEDQEAIIRAKFEDRMKRDGLNFEWRQVRLTVPDISEAVIRHSREASLIIVSQDLHSQKGQDAADHLAADVVLGSGRPALIVPPQNGKAPKISKAVIGWNGSREASRAAYDSVPLLKLAKQVFVIWANPEKNLKKSGKLPGTELGKALAGHDIKIITKGLNNRSKPARALLNFATEETADLLVLGAYGHSRLRERILGGVTEYVLRHMTVPVLMSN